MIPQKGNTNMATQPQRKVMTYEQALQLVNANFSKLTGTREDHEILQQAEQLLVEAVAYCRKKEKEDAANKDLPKEAKPKLVDPKKD